MVRAVFTPFTVILSVAKLQHSKELFLLLFLFSAIAVAQTSMGSEPPRTGEPALAVSNLCQGCWLAIPPANLIYKGNAVTPVAKEIMRFKIRS